MFSLTFHILVYLSLGFVASILGSIIFLRNKKDTVYRTFGLLNLGIVIWAFGCVAWLFQDNESLALFWTRIFSIGSTLIPVFLLHWILAFLKKDQKFKRILKICYIVSCVFLLFSFTPFYIKGVKPMLFFPFWPQAGMVYFLHLILSYLGMSAFGFYQLFLAYRRAAGDTLVQIKYVIFGLILGLGGGATNFPLMFGFSLPFPPLNFLIIAYPLVFSYAMLKYKFMDIKIILTEFLIFLLGALLLLEIFLSQSLNLIVYKSGILIFFGIFGYLLVRSVYEEIKTKERVEALSQKLQKAYQELKRVDLAKSEFISIASHQLRTPLTVIKGYVSLLLDKKYGDAKRADEMLKNIYLSNERLIKLINDLLDLSKIELGKMQFDFKEISFENIIDSVVRELEIVAKNKALYLKWEKPENLPKILGDFDKLRQVVLNVVDNAIKYTREGGLTINLKHQLSGGKNVILAEFSDTGMGIKKDELEAIFKGFDRGSYVQKTHEGTGLGLMIASRIIKAHKGKIWAESEGQGKGSTLFIELPVK